MFPCTLLKPLLLMLIDTIYEIPWLKPFKWNIKQGQFGLTSINLEKKILRSITLGRNGLSSHTSMGLNLTL